MNWVALTIMVVFALIILYGCVSEIAKAIAASNIAKNIDLDKLRETASNLEKQMLDESSDDDDDNNEDDGGFYHPEDKE